MIAAALHGLCAAAYVCVAALILAHAYRSDRPGRTAFWMAAGCLATAVWAVAGLAAAQAPLGGLAGRLDLLRSAVWYGLLLHLYRRVAPPPDNGTEWPLGRALGTMAMVALLAAATGLLLGHVDLGGRVSFGSAGFVLRLALAICQLLLVENLYRNAPEEARWTINLTCVGLGGLAAFDTVLCADAVLFHVASSDLIAARPVVATLVAPLLAIAAARNRRWGIDIHVSRTVVFHSATLVVSGVFLLALALAGEVVRRLGGVAGGNWGSVAEISLLFAGALTTAALLASGSARSLLRAAVVDHFFTSRYDYRQEWLRCIETLSGGDATPLHRRVVRAAAQVVDSPAGLLLLREPGESGLHWAGSWNLPPVTAPLAADHPLLPRLLAADGALVLSAAESSPPLDSPSSLWLAVPLLHAGTLCGCILVAHPRAPFRLDREVFDLLRVIAHEASGYLAEQRAARVMVEARELREYGQRFAFVAHDIKNVSSQLSLLLSNAEHHIANPDFQRDMLATVAASIRKIGGLIRRLQQSGDPLAGVPAQESVVLPDRLQAVADATQRLRGRIIAVEDEGWQGEVAMAPAAFDMVLTHLLDNAIEASPPAAPIRMHLGGTARTAQLDIVDQGCGMHPEFVRDELFRPFRTSKPEGSGIGAFQARALLREAGGDLQVTSALGCGTTMRLLLPRADTVAAAPHVPTRVMAGTLSG